MFGPNGTMRSFPNFVWRMIKKLVVNIDILAA